MELLCLATGLAALLSALAVTPVARRLAQRLGFLDQPGPRKIHTKAVPYGGGIAVFVSLGISVLLAALLVQVALREPSWAPWRRCLVLRQEQFDPALLRLLTVCLAGALGAFFLGLLDDCRELRPAAKLAGQFALAIVVVACGVRATVLIGDNLLTQAATVCWIVLLTNSFNLLDNMDGLCIGVVAVCAALLAFFAGRAGQAPAALLLCALAGASLGFLKWNRSPASIFLGDAGSQGLGFLLATVSVVTTYYHYKGSVLSLGVPLLIFAVPLYDTASVLAIRLRERRNLLAGDTSHFSHRLVDLGMSQRQAVGTIHLAALATGLPAAVIPALGVVEGLLLAAQAVLILMLIALLERAGRTKGGARGGPEGRT